VTIRKETFTDKLLAIMGKKRAVWIPHDVYKRFGTYVIVLAKRNPFRMLLPDPKVRSLRKDGFITLNSA